MRPTTALCLAPIFQFWTQHNYPEQSAGSARQVDDCLAHAAAICHGQASTTDEFAARRMRLPARMFGGGFRSLGDTAPAAFVGTLCRCVQRMLDRVCESGGTRPGFMPGLAAALGHDAFNPGSEESRFAPLLGSGLPSGNAFSRAWTSMQAEVGDSEGPLQANAQAAGVGIVKLQKALTRQREQRRFQSLDVSIRALPAGDMRRAAWLNLDRFSTVWVTAMPTREALVTNAEFQEIVAMYYGMPSPACASLVGERIANTRSTLDAYGNRLASLTLPGDGWRTQHDALKWRVFEDAREMQARVRPEVFGLFAACIPREGRARANQAPRRKRQGLVPDLLLHVPVDGPERPLLYELKTLHYGSSTYVGEDRRCEAVARRARALPGEYAAKAREADRTYCGSTEGEVGPVELKLRTFEPVRGLVFGAWGEASPQAESLLGALAEVGATRHWRGMRCCDADAAKGALAWLLRRRWGLTALRENARLKLERLELVGRGAAAAASRRVAGRAVHAARARRSAVALAPGPRSAGLLRRG